MGAMLNCTKQFFKTLQTLYSETQIIKNFISDIVSPLLYAYVCNFSWKFVFVSFSMTSKSFLDPARPESIPGTCV